MATSNPDPRFRRAQALIDDLLARRGAGQAASFDALLSLHPDVSGELRALWRTRDRDAGGAAATDETSQVIARLLSGFKADQMVQLRDPESTDDRSTPGAPPTTTGTPLPTQPNRYRLLRELGHGGMGVVYLGHDLDLGRKVAIKFLRPSLCHEETVLRRFLEEAQIGGQLEHPGIVPVYELGLAGTQPFFAMKLIKGTAFSQRLAERPSPEQDLARNLAIFEQVCHAVGYAHARGVIHRDLKPSNIMIGSFGEVQVVDWGMGKVLADADSATASSESPPTDSVSTVRRPAARNDSLGSVLGTPMYMPPEQARGERVDQRSDVFALGAILCEILTGLPPYGGIARAGRAQDPLERAANAELDDAREHLAACGADATLVQLCRDCLEPDPGKRPPAAANVAARIADYRAEMEQRAQQARLKAAVARTRVRQLVAFSIVLALAFGTVLYFMFAAHTHERSARAAAEAARRATAIAEANHAAATAAAELATRASQRADAEAQAARRSAQEADEQRDLATKARQAEEMRAKEAEAASTRAVEAKEEADRQRALAVAARDNAERAQRAAQAAYEEAQEARQREQAAYRERVAALNLAREEQERAAARVRREVYAARLAAAESAAARGEMIESARQLASCDAAYRGFEWHHLRLAADRALAVRSLARPLHGVAVGPGVCVVATGGADGELCFLDPETLAIVRSVLAHPGGALAVACSRDGRLLASGGIDGAVRLWDARQGTVLRELLRAPQRITCIAFDASGGRVACGGWDGHAYVVDATSGTLLHDLGPHEDGVSAVRFVPEALVVGTARGDVCRYDERGRLVARSAAHGDAVLAIAASGPLLATGSVDGVIRLSSTADDTTAISLRVPGAGTTALEFSADGSTLVSAHTDARLRVWELGTSTVSGELPGHTDLVTAIALMGAASEGKAILSVAVDGTVRRWKRTAATPVAAFTTTPPMLDTLGLAVLEHGFVTAGSRRSRTVSWVHDRLALQETDFAASGWLAPGPSAPDAGGGQPSMIVAQDTTDSSLAFSADGSRLAIVLRDGRAWVWDTAKGTLAGGPWQVPEEPTCVALRGADALLVGTTLGSVFACAPARPAVAILSGRNPITAVAAAVASDVTVVAVRGEPPLIVRPGRPDLNATVRANVPIVSLALDPLGQRLAVGCEDGAVHVLDVETGSALIRLQGRSLAVRGLAFSARGDRLGALHDDGTVVCFEADVPQAHHLWGAGRGAPGVTVEFLR